MFTAGSNIDTIAAISTPSGTGGIGIIKISGPSAQQIRGQLFRASRKASAPASHHLHYGIVVDPEDEQTIDEVLVSWMAAPNTYTGEDVVEINSHGGRIVLHRILGLVLKAGARLADPGEFTKRAFLNGRIDLTQAEAVIDLITAKTNRAAQNASRQVTGELRNRIEAVGAAIRDGYAEVAARIDFPDDTADEHQSTAGLVAQLRVDVLAPMERFIENQQLGQVIREGARIAVVGRPNVGKSSLMNRLLDKDRVIVSDAPGTTRDAVADITSIEGIPIVFVDTAGLRDTVDPIEAIGIQKTREALASAQLVLFLVEAGLPMTEEDEKIRTSLGELPVILVRNKMDLTNAPDLPSVIPQPGKLVAVTVSAKHGDNIPALKRCLVDMLSHGHGDGESDDIMPNQRQAGLLVAACESMRRAIDILESRGEDELVAIEMDAALASINQILGLAAPEDIMDTVFERFCIGK